jgi:hypothetical protein
VGVRVRQKIKGPLPSIIKTLEPELDQGQVPRLVAVVVEVMAAVEQK